MKKTLLSLMCVAAFGYANAAEVVNLNCNDVDQSTIEGTYFETTYKEDGSVNAYAHWQPVESLVLGGFTFSFYAPDTYMDGDNDNTHLRPEGAKWVASRIVSELSLLDPKPAFIE